MLAGLLGLSIAATVAGAQEATEDATLTKGAAVYSAQCASCHGAKGEGVEDFYAQPLAGDATIGELTRVIAETMPEGEPEKCAGPDAAAVAQYIHHSFYSEAAQVRNRPPRIGLARLTGNQLRQSLSDLYAHFGSIASVSEERGVKGAYYNGDQAKKENLKIERVDPQLQFDFGKESPGEGIQAESFVIHWEGSLKVDVTGRYDLIARSTCSFTLNFGKQDRTLIDNHVQSGDKTEFRRTLMLTAGRVYPLKIDFIQRKRKTELPPANFSLSWTPPNGIEQIVPSQNLLPSSGPPVFSLQANLPPDDRSYGFERGIAINRQWDDSTTAAALEFAQTTAIDLWPRYRRQHRDDPNENRAQLKSFLKELVETAFRGPIDDSVRQVLIDQQVEQEADDVEAIKRVVLIALKSPRFLYPLADSDRSPSQRAANRLALTLYDSLPSDESLLRAVEKDELNNADQIRQAAKRMVNDYRVQAKTRELMYEWLNLTHLGEISKDPEKFPGFDAALVSDLRASFDAFLDTVLWSPESDYRQLFMADWSFTSPRMADFYGESWKATESPGAPRARTSADPQSRHGLLTHPYLMSGLAYHDSTSPIHRGVFLIRYMLGRTLRPPNEAFTPLSPDLHPDLTTRERVALQTSPESCQVCHIKINGLGFALENYDAVGRLRTTEREKPINASGQYADRADQSIQFTGASELAAYLASSSDAHRGFVSRAFQHFVKQPPAAYGAQTLDELTRRFGSSGYNIRELIIEIAVVAATNRDGTVNQDGPPVGPVQ